MPPPTQEHRARSPKDRCQLRHFTFSKSHLASTHVKALTKGFLQQGHILRNEQQAERHSIHRPKIGKETKEASNDQQECNEETNCERGRLYAAIG